MRERVIWSLCDGTGAWSDPYRRDGYIVIPVSLPDRDVRTWRPLGRPHGILAAPPCTEFARSGARWWKDKDPALLIEALEVVDACLRIIGEAKPCFWALENPIGRLRRLRPELGEPRLVFDPCDYGDPWTKRTQVFGAFSPPPKSRVDPTRRDFILKTPSSAKQAERRSVTPPGFARAFFEANP